MKLSEAYQCTCILVLNSLLGLTSTFFSRYLISNLKHLVCREQSHREKDPEDNPRL